MINDLMKIISNQQAQRLTLKGKTIKYNNLVQNGNFASTSGWNTTRATLTTTNNVANLNITELVSVGDGNRINSNNFTTIVGHKYLVLADLKTPRQATISVRIFDGNSYILTNREIVEANVWLKKGGIYTAERNVASIFLCVYDSLADNFSVGSIVNF